MTTPRLLGGAAAADTLDVLGPAVAAAGGPVLIAGAAGTGKSTLAARLARRLAGTAICRCLALDPGSPAFGAPGAVSLGTWQQDAWALEAYEALCTLDAGRFRLPLVAAAGHLLPQAADGVLLVDLPGLTRGMAAGELLSALSALVSPALIVMLARGSVPLADELAAAGCDVMVVESAAAARRPGGRARARRRTAQWDAWLAAAREVRLPLSALAVTGAPPPRGVPPAWAGRQVALLERGRTVAFGEVAALAGVSLRARLRGGARGDAVLVRDAARDERGELATAEPFARHDAGWLPASLPAPIAPAAGGPRPVARVGPLDAVLINGVFGDPLVHLKVRHRRRGLLFDLGDMARLPARLAHQVTDVFVSHAHMDHIGGFLWLLRSQLGVAAACRLYGPPGLAAHLESLIAGIEWDRIGDAGPVFEVHELHGARLERHRLVAGQGRRPLADRPAGDGVLHREAGFQVRATVLDHGIPVLAFAFEPAMEVHVRKDRLLASGLAPGPWLTALRTAVLAGEPGVALRLPDGRERSAASLADELLLIAPGRRLVYATDLADTPANRDRLVALSADAHTLFCEAPFLARDAAQARRTGHLTARACGEIGAAAGVRQLIPFHFSRRYQHDPAAVYAEVADACPRTVRPPAGTGGETRPCSGRSW